ncbi:MAG TPA: XrtA/PEP-CTERM system-associated ATPase [Novosphingobium sp.]|nr:XrtA/PEP-CTERM system-associated ATPase [Novosphingobium sp.]
MFDDFYGFTARPFQLTPDPAFYFESTTHRKALSYLGFGLAQGEGFIVITGEVGAGKSTLVAHLMATIDRARLTAGQIVTSRLDGEEMVHLAAQAFGLKVPGHDKASALGAIEAFLHAEARAGRRCLLVVDESQNLSVEALEELRMLSNFQLGSHPLLQILLLGQPEFRESLEGHPRLEQLRQRVIAAHHLEAMAPEELEPYVQHRLRLVGWQGRPGFAADLFGALHRATGGIPRRVNQVLNRLLIFGAVERTDYIDCAMLEQVLADLGSDGLRPLDHNTRVASPVAEPSPVPAAAAGLQALQGAIAQRDAQIAELQQAVIELASAAEASGQPVQGEVARAIGLIEERLTALENRLSEQEHTLRHTLTMLIEWMERDDAQRVAA